MSRTPVGGHSDSKKRATGPLLFLFSNPLFFKNTDDKCLCWVYSENIEERTKQC